MSKLNQQGFTVIETLLFIVAVLLLGFGGYYVYTANFSNSNDQAVVADGRLISCDVTSDIEICISTSDETYSSSSKIELSTSLKNVSDTEFTSTFNSTCTEPTVYINDTIDSASVAGVCGQAITTVKIAPDETLDYTYFIDGSKLNVGDNKISIRWAKLSSPYLNVTKTQDAEADKVAAAECLEGISSGSCVEFLVLHDNINRIESCADVAYLYEDLGIKPAAWWCDNPIGVGAIPFLVPRDDLQIWKARFEELPEVETTTAP